MVTTLDILLRTKELITCGWTQGAFWRDRHGKVCLDHKHANCFCLSGARRAAAKELNAIGTDASVRASELLKIAAGGAVIEFNDAPGRTHKEVLDVIGVAIAAAEKEAA